MRRPGAAPGFPHAPSLCPDAAFPARPDSAAGSRAPTGGYGVTVPTAHARETGPAARRAAPGVPGPRDGLGGRGADNAIRFGIDAAAAPVAVVTMADGCDNPAQIDSLSRLVDPGVVVAAA